MATKEAIKAANEIVYESWRNGSDGDLYCDGQRKLEQWPELRDVVAEAMDKFRSQDVRSRKLDVPNRLETT